VLTTGRGVKGGRENTIEKGGKYKKIPNDSPKRMLIFVKRGSVSGGKRGGSGGKE